MNDTGDKKPLGLRAPGARPGNVKQSFSHGRTKNVVVETKARKRVVATPPAAPAPAGTATRASAILGDPSKRPAGISDAELERRMKALAAGRAREAEEAIKRAEERAMQAYKTPPGTAGSASSRSSSSTKLKSNITPWE